MAHISETPTASQGESFSEFLARTKEQPIYVILGVQGSGTNLLRSILVRAFNFAVVQDQSLVFNAAAAVGRNPSEATVGRELRSLQARLFPSGIGGKMNRRVKSNGSFAGLEQYLDPARFTSGADLARLVYSYAAYSLGTTRMAIKSDDLWESIQHIDTVLPNRRIILLTRDFRDNLLSITKKDFGPIDPIIAAQYVKKRFSHYAAEFRRTPPDLRFHVRYEELLETPDSFVERIGRHFGLTEGSSPPEVDKGRIRRNNVRKWAVLSPSTLAAVEAILREELESYGYGTETKGTAAPGAGTLLAARVRDTVHRVPQKLKNISKRLRR